ncbi:MAG: hypothetical protein R3A43_04930 [Bacteroidia bacterium]
MKRYLYQIDSGTIEASYCGDKLFSLGRIRNKTVAGIWFDFYNDGRLRYITNYENGLISSIAPCHLPYFKVKINNSYSDTILIGQKSKFRFDRPEVGRGVMVVFTSVDGTDLSDENPVELLWAPDGSNYDFTVTAKRLVGWYNYEIIYECSLGHKHSLKQKFYADMEN